MNTPLTIWTNHFFEPDEQLQFEKLAAPHRVVVSSATSRSNLVAGGRDPAALTADVLHGQPHVQDVLDSDRVKWVQLTTAGYTRFDSPDVLDAMRRKGLAFCNASSLYDEPCAQHVVAMLLACARALPEACADQAGAHWNYLPLRARSFLLRGQKTLLVGYGAIARRVVELLTPYRLQIKAFRRAVRGDENCPTLPIAQLDEHLPDADIVINILPASPATRNFFDRDRVARIRRGAMYVNIGRGNTNDQDALADALREGRLSRVCLDVTAPEPLPREHALWSAPNLLLTPHTAGGTGDEPQRMIEHVIANLRRFQLGEPLADRIV